jgi:hypothetical protein
MVTLTVGPAVPDDCSTLSTAVKAPVGVNGLSFFVSTPRAPTSISSGCEVTAVGPTETLVTAPVAVARRSTRPVAAMPANSLAAMARATAVGWLTVIVSPDRSAVPTLAEQTTVRTPVVSVPFATSASTE